MDSTYYRKEKKRFYLPSGLRKLVRNRRVMLAVIVGIPAAAFILFGSHGLVQRFKLQHQKAELEQKILQAEAETKRLEAESRALDGDRRALERVAREKHGMIREGETVYRVKRKK
jgi:cell division protein FtsB